MELTKSYTRHLTPYPNKYFFDFKKQLTSENVQGWMEQVLKKISEVKTPADWEEAIYFWNEIKSHVQTHFELIELAFQCHTDDPKIEREERRLKDEVEPVFEEWNAKIREKVLASEHLQVLKERIGAQYFVVLKLAQEAFDPKNIELETRLNQVLSDYTKLTGGAFFIVDGKKYPLGYYKKFSSSSEARLRKESFLSYSGWFMDHRNKLEEIYDKSVALRQEMGTVLGHENFTLLGYQKMQRIDYGTEEVAMLREQIQEVVVPIGKKIREWQAQTLGKDRVSIWDMDFFPAWELGELKVPVQEQTRAALKIYEQLSPRLGEHFRKMIQWEMIDLEARVGKAPGAFCTDLSDFRVPFIFLNSVQEATDVSTMLHESGHCFQAWESRNIDALELRWPTLEACEVHSMGMEFLAYPYYEVFFHPSDAEKFRKRHLADSILLLPYIAMVDEFQHQVYGEKASGAEGRAQSWEALEEKYMPGVDFSDAPAWKRHRWVRQLHIFKAPFYYIDYAIAQIGAWQLWMQSLKNKDEAMKNYLNLCRLGGVLPLKGFFSEGNLKLPFKPGVLKPLMEEILETQPLF